VDSPKYADLDWKTTLAEVVEDTEETHQDEPGYSVRMVETSPMEELEVEELEVEEVEIETSLDPEGEEAGSEDEFAD
jgi:hypothetical protein